ncbi:anti-sigma factor [Chloroflexus sp.]|uniref:anti-sigma factor n=1 Tax=Chloroflexus sp. TaxID=1904827 RepID=UPI002FD9E3EF
MGSSREHPDDITELLAAYALDALDSTERARVQHLLMEQPELQQTLAELRSAADLLPQALERPSLPPELRQRTLDYAVGRSPTVRRSFAGSPGKRLWSWLEAKNILVVTLGVLLLIAVGVINGFNTELNVVRQQRDQALSQVATAQIAAQQLAVLLTASAPLATLTGELGQGVVVRDEAGDLVVIATLPSLPASQVYQLWLIEGAAAPTSGGIFTVDANGYGIVRLPGLLPQSGTTFAITAEPAPGSPAPTGSILISGQVS